MTKVPPPPPPGCCGKSKTTCPCCPINIFSFCPLLSSKKPDILAPRPPSFHPEQFAQVPLAPEAPNASIKYFPVYGTFHSWIPLLRWTWPSSDVPKYPDVLVGPTGPCPPSVVKTNRMMGSVIQWPYTTPCFTVKSLKWLANWEDELLSSHWLLSFAKLNDRHPGTDKHLCAHEETPWLDCTFVTCPNMTWPSRKIKYEERISSLL